MPKIREIKKGVIQEKTKFCFINILVKKSKEMKMKKLLIFTMIAVFIVSIGFAGAGCKATTAETTAAETTVAETTVAETTVAETTVAETTVAETTAAETTAKKLKIASAVMNCAWPWFLGTVEGMENVVKEKGNIDFSWQDSAFDINTQVKQLEDFMQLGVDGVIIFPVDSKAIIPTMGDLAKAGIKIVVGDYPQQTTNDSEIVWETFVGHNFKDLGKAAGQIAADYLKTTNIEKPICAFVSLPSVGQAGVDRLEGFKEVVLESFPDAEIIEVGDTAGSRDSAQTTFENFLQITPHIDIVSGHNDAMVLGAYAAAQTQGRDEIKFIGLAGDKEVLGYLQDGNEDWIGEVLQDPIILGETCMQALLKALGGAKLEAKTPLSSPAIITKDNINDYDWKNWTWLG
jgi:ABC-type sugar transport system substrate-binding protein